MDNNNDFKLIAFASNKSGNRIFCRLIHKKQTMLKGYYDFNQEKFFVTKYVKSNFIQGIGKNTIKKHLIELLDIEYDWKM